MEFILGIILVVAGLEILRLRFVVKTICEANIHIMDQLTTHSHLHGQSIRDIQELKEATDDLEQDVLKIS